MRLYLSYLKNMVNAQLQYRSSFLLLALGQTVIPFTTLAGILILFGRFGTLGGWSREEALLCYGVTHMAFSLATCFARGFDSFQNIVRDGEFDRILVRPRGTVLQVLGSRLDMTRAGRLMQGIIVLAYALSAAKVDWNPLKTMTLAAMVLSGTFIFSGIYMLGAALCFKTIQGVEVINILSDGGRECAQYPVSIYPESLKTIFTFVIPFACFNYIPLLMILDKPGGGLIAGSSAPWLGMLFVVPCVWAWNRGVRNYLSTGS